MAKYAALVEENTDTTGTAQLDMTGATPGHRRVHDAFSADDYVHYLLRDKDKTMFERGYGKVSSVGNSLSREFIKESSAWPNRIQLPGGGGHQVTISPNPDSAHPGGFLVRYVQTGDIPSGVATKLNWNTSAPEYDTDNMLPLATYQDLPIPDYVSKIRVSAEVMIAENATGSRRFWMEGAQGWYGLPKIDFPGHLTNSSFQYLQFTSGIIDVDLQLQQRSFSIWLQQDSGVPLEVRGTGPTVGFLLCEYTE